MKVTRISDMTSGICDLGLICCPHSRSGSNSTGANFFEVDGKPIHRKGDSGNCNCPHGGTFTSTQGSSIFDVDGKPIALTSHSTSCNVCGCPGSHSSGCNFFEVSS